MYRIFLLIFLAPLHALHLPGLIPQVHKAMNSGVAIGVVDVAQVHYKETFGQMTPHSKVEVSDLHSPLLALEVAKLADRGYVNWDTPVQRYLPALWLPDPVVTRELTLRDCLSEQGGLSGGSFRASYHQDPKGIELVKRVVEPRSKRPLPSEWTLNQALEWLSFVLSKGVVHKKPTLNPARVEELFEPQVIRFDGIGNGLLRAQALGWAIEEIDGNRVAWSFGEQGGLVVMPDWGIGVVVLGDADVRAIALAVVDGLMGRVALKELGDVFFLPPRSYL